MIHKFVTCKHRSEHKMDIYIRPTEGMYVYYHIYMHYHIGCIELLTPQLLLYSQGLVQTFIDNWPQYEHRICCRHLYNNLKKNHPGVLIRELFWKAAKANYKAEFDRLMDELKGIDEDAYSWLQDHSTTILVRHMFSEDGLSDTVLNNMCESFNSRILKFRSKPIITMV